MMARSMAMPSPCGSQRLSNDVLSVEEGSLYPALYRMERRGWLASDVGADRHRPAGAVLQDDQERPGAARGGDRELAAADHGGRLTSSTARSALMLAFRIALARLRALFRRDSHDG